MIVNGKEFIQIPGQGRIHKEYLPQFVYVKTGRAIDEWTKGFELLNLLLPVKIEQAKQATH